MLSRLIFPALALFWVTMNLLLWQSEFGARDLPGSGVPPEVVWRKILTAPDSSTLNIYHRDERIGLCHWVTSVSEAAANFSESPTARMAQASAGWNVEFDGKWMLSRTNYAKFNGQVRMKNERDLRELAVRLEARDWKLEVAASSPDNEIHLKADGAGLNFAQTLTFEELQNPGAVLQKLARPYLGEFAQNFSWPSAQATATSTFSHAVKWKARSETLQIRHASLRVFRLETELWNRQKLVVVANGDGDLLKIELPDQIVLLQESLSHF